MRALVALGVAAMSLSAVPAQEDVRLKELKRTEPGFEDLAARTATAATRSSSSTSTT